MVSTRRHVKPSTRGTVLAAITWVLALAWFGVPAAAGPTTSLHGTIAITSFAGESTHIYLLHLGTGEVTKLPGSAGMRAVEWSPHGARLLIAEAFGSQLEVRSVRADGSSSIRLARDVSSDARWSPSGTRVAFASGGSLYVVDASGKHRRLLARGVTEHVAFLGENFSWAPDGKRIVFAHDHRLSTVSTTGKPVVRRVRYGLHGQHTAAQPAWSPDGSRIAFVASGLGGALPMVVMKADGSGAEVLTGGHGLVWSPDSALLAFRSDGNQVIRVGARLTSNLEGSWSGITFSPDSRSVAYVGGLAREPNGDVYVANADGSNAVRVLHLPDDSVALPLWRGGTATTDIG